MGQHTESLVEIEKAEAAEARAKFVDALWRDSAPRLLLPLAEAAGVSAAEADRLRGQIAEARTLMKRANQLALARTALTVAQQQVEGVTAKAAGLRAEADQVERAAVLAVQQAQAAVTSGNQACKELLVLSERDPSFLPQSRLPDICKQLAAKRATAAEQRAAEGRAIERRNRVTTLERELDAAKLTLRRTLPGCATRPRLQREVERLTAALAAAQNEATGA